MTTAPRRVLFLTGLMGGGGAERHLLALIEALASFPIERHLAIGRAGGSFEVDLPDDLEVTHLRERSAPSALLAAMSWRRPLRRLLESYRPDLVFSILEHTNVLSLLSRVDPRTIHIVGIQNALSMKYSHGPLGRRVLGRLVRATYPRADGLIACSAATASDTAGFLGLAAERVVSVPNTTRNDIGQRALEPLDVERPEGPLVVACGRLLEQKGFPTLIEALRLLRESVPASLWIIGDGPDRAALERQIADAGLNDHVTLLGFRDNPWNAIAAADVFALSSRWEGYPLVLHEAMRCETPIVSTDCPDGTSEALEDGRCGLLVPLGDTPALAAGLRQVLEDRALAARLVENGLDHARRTAPSVIAGQYYEIFERKMRAGRG